MEGDVKSTILQALHSSMKTMFNLLANNEFSAISIFVSGKIIAWHSAVILYCRDVLEESYF